MTLIRIQNRRGNSSAWTSADPTLEPGEIGVESDTGKFKIGDGSTAWTTLAYAATRPTDLTNTVDDYVRIADVGTATFPPALNSSSNLIIPGSSIIVEGTTANAHETTLEVTDPTADRTVTFQDATGTVVLRDSTDTLTNKSISLGSNTVTSTLAQLNTAVSDADVASLAGTETLTNKTLTSPTVSGLTISDSSIVIEGSTANAFETTLTVTDPTADRTITFPDTTGTVALTSNLNSYVLNSAIGGATGVAGLDASSNLVVPGSKIIVEGATDNSYETSIEITDPTADRTITVPNATGTMITTGNLTDITSVGTLSSLTVSGDLTVNGTTTTLNSTTLSVDDKNIEIGSVDTPTDITANGGGIVLKGATDKTILWSSDSGAWTSSEDIALSAAKALIFEGATDNAYETKLTVVDPTGDRTITFPNETGTVAIESWVSSALSAYVTTATVGSTVASLVDGRVPSNQLTTGVAFMSDVSTAKTAAEQTAAADATSKVSAHETDTTSIHGIADTAALATKAGTETFTNKTLTSPKINENVAVTATATEINLLDGVTATTAELNILDGVTSTAAELNLLDGVTATTAELNILDGVTSTASELNILDGATLSVTELNYVDGVTSAIQTQLDDKSTASKTETFTNKTLTSPKINENVAVTATATELNVLDGITSSTTELNILDGVTADAAEINILDGALLSTTELNYVDGVTSAIQTQLNNKAPLNAPTFTGTVTSTNNLVVDGNLTVNGTTFNASSTSITIEDNLVLLANENVANTVDLGIVVAYNDGANKRSGIVRDVSADKWKLFKGVTTEPSTTVDFTQGSLDDLELNAIVATSATIGSVSNTELQYLDGVTSAIQTQIDAKAPTNNASFTGTFSAPSGTVTSTMIANDTIVNADINSAAAIDWTKLAISSTVSATELGYVDGVTSAIQTQLDAKTPELYTFVTDATTSRTLALGDKFASLRFTSASAITVTVPANSAVAFPIGSYVELYAYGSGQITVTQSAGVTVNATDAQKKSRVQYSSMTLIKIATDEWLLVGDTAA